MDHDDVMKLFFYFFFNGHFYHSITIIKLLPTEPTLFKIHTIMVDHNNHQRHSFYGSIECAKDQHEANHSGGADDMSCKRNHDCGDEQNVHGNVQKITTQKRNMIHLLFSLIFCVISMLLYVSSINPTLMKTTKSKSNTSNEDGIIMDIMPGDIKQAHTKNGSNSRQDAVLPKEQDALLRDHRSAAPPFSTLDPVNDLKVYPYRRPKPTTPGIVFGEKLHKGQSETGIPLPTNNWYENMVLMSDEQIAPNSDNRIYSVPYVVSGDGPVSGIKLGSTRLLGMEKVVQVTYIDDHGLTLGAAESFGMSNGTSFGGAIQRRYMISDDASDYEDSDTNTTNYSPLTPLGLTLKWVCIILST